LWRTKDPEAAPCKAEKSTLEESHRGFIADHKLLTRIDTAI
jgi:hypothetical protein